MAAGDVAGFVCQDADDFIGVARGDEQPCVDKNSLPAGHKGIKGRVLNQVYPHGRGFKSGNREQWCPEQTNGILNLRVADKGKLSRLGRS